MTWWEWTLLGIALWGAIVLFALSLCRAASSPPPHRPRTRARKTTRGRSDPDLGDDHQPPVALDDERARRIARAARMRALD